jgi:hypothetical protein
MSLIEINSDVKLLTKELRRIAEAIETYLLLEYGYRQEAVSIKELQGEEPDVSYSSDEETMKREFDIAIGRAKDVLEEDQ